ncbi:MULTISPECIES: M3 family metallopeptidase [unclassified Cyanobium]|uniref:M3 family metallopeptidase n=1 Tax=unclassified Cyanobium TaxID=2627006 RepID=UPI0020CF4115|nr:MULTISPECIES: M3 family metallopeptidase [unclassified Cyanobium]MCP9834573.1 M3 family metallopeptidase [Cyanobium sp. La Preciosa 7G6]MCP9937336.1 M3 family metallopeptidase [Cyanobium sp. Aljojuca 7A6]
MTSTLQSPPALLAGEGLPRFEAITPDQVRAHIPELLNGLQAELDRVEADLAAATSAARPLTWAEVMDPLHRLGERLRWSWGVVSHLNGVCNSTELREAHASQQAAVVAFGNRSGQSRVLYEALRRLQSQGGLDATQERILTAELRDMELRGVGLEGAAQEAFNAASQELAELATAFGNRVLDATNSWTVKLTDPAEVEGLPESLREQLAQAARDAGDGQATAAAGPWLLGLDMPRFGPFLKYSRRRDLREIAYKAHVSRASGESDGNWPAIERILTLRRVQAHQLGHGSWAEVSLASKMAGSVAEVEALLEDLRTAAYPVALLELEALRACAAREGAAEAGDFKPWDVSFWAEVRRQQAFDLDSEALRPWFPLPRVLEGLFGLCDRLFGLHIHPADGEAPVWHPDVRFFRVDDAASGEPLAAFYLDPYSRPGSKRGGAWMDECLVRSLDASGQPVLPVAYLVCNQSPPVGDTPSLMTFEEVETLFHEFGHGLQHMLTTVERPQAAGINNVEWDAVELPSQFMENWCYDHATLMGMARHWQSGEPLPEVEFAKLRAARTFMGGAATLRQVHFALTDLRLHSQWTPECGQTPEQLRREIAATTTVLEPIEEDAFLCSFGHIFAGGYSAGYYSYKWAEVLSADAFSAFEEVGLENEAAIQATGRRFRETVLSLGGSRHPGEVFETFRGRAPSPEALIRHSGLGAAGG